MKNRLVGWFRRAPRPEPVHLHPAPIEIREVSNTDLSEEDIPRVTEETYERLIAFAATFDGYRHWGSFEKCFAVGVSPKDRSVRTLTELRTELFCWFRVCAHDGTSDIDDLTQPRQIIAEIRDRVKRGAVD